MDNSWQIIQAKTLVTRLERLSADSVWSHRACGIRGSLLRSIEELESGTPDIRPENLDELMAKGFLILSQAIQASYKTRFAAN
jgi:hypothetical protein